MARKSKYLIVRLMGTNLNDSILVKSHEIIPYPSSTYHKFVFPNDCVIYRNDFGVSQVTIDVIELTEEEALARMKPY